MTGKGCTLWLFSSPEPKTQVSLSDQNLSIVRRCRRCRHRWRWRCRKLFTFSSSSPKMLGLLQPNVAQYIPGWRGFKSVQTKGSAFFQGEIIKKIAKIHWRNKKKIFSRTTASISTKRDTKYSWVIRTQICSNEGPTLYQREIITK